VPVALRFSSLRECDCTTEVLRPDDRAIRSISMATICPSNARHAVQR
jgi:hypothetical protein